MSAAEPVPAVLVAVCAVILVTIATLMVAEWARARSRGLLVAAVVGQAVLVSTAAVALAIRVAL